MMSEPPPAPQQQQPNAEPNAEPRLLSQGPPQPPQQPMTAPPQPAQPAMMSQVNPEPPVDAAEPSVNDELMLLENLIMDCKRTAPEPDPCALPVGAVVQSLPPESLKETRIGV